MRYKALLELTELPDERSLAEVFRVSIEEIREHLRVSEGFEPPRTPLNLWARLNRLRKTALERSLSNEAVFGWVWTEPELRQESLPRGAIELELSDFTTHFHQTFWTRERQDQLIQFLREQPFFYGEALVSRLWSRYNEERFMGPESVVKHRYCLLVSLDPSTLPLGRVVYLEVEFKPSRDRFHLRTLRQGFVWREPALKSVLLEFGLIDPYVWADQEARYETLKNAYMFEARPSFLKHLVRVGVLNSDSVVQTLHQVGPLRCATQEELSQARLPGGPHSADLQCLRWVLEAPGLAVFADPQKVEHFPHLGFEGYREVRLTTSAQFQQRWDSLIPP